jgi:EAL domain-containing protein (putative c-di-GMP-specific phosphodiesterase class I)/FixJ family two-component response regulator
LRKEKGKKMPRILIVDDEPLVRNQIASVLEKQGYEVEIALSSQMALQMCKSRRFDLTLVDYNLPSINGIELLEEFRTLQPSCLRVLITDMLNLHQATKASNIGLLTGFIEKPYTSEKLLGTVKGVVDIRQKMIEVAKIQREASRLEEEKILQECLDNDSIYVSLQPLIGSFDGKISAFEVFLRSKHAILNNPTVLLRAVRKHNKLESLSDIIFSKVLDVLQQLEGEFLLFLNFHCDELSNKEALQSRLQVLQQYSSRIVFEITDRNRLKSIVDWEKSIELMKGMGFRIAIDNLGVENTTLSILSDMEPNFFKIDMSMIRNINQQAKHRKFVELLCKLGATMNVDIVAEGIETEEELKIVKDCGAQLLQGFYFEKPSKDIPGLQQKLQSTYL